MSEGSNANSTEEERRSPQQATYNPATRELSVRYPDGHVESITIEKEELTRVASKADPVGWKLEGNKQSDQQKSKQSDQQK